MEFYDFPYNILGMSSSQLTFIFFRGVDHRPVYVDHIFKIVDIWISFGCFTIL